MHTSVCHLAAQFLREYQASASEEEAARLRLHEKEAAENAERFLIVEETPSQQESEPPRFLIVFCPHSCKFLRGVLPSGKPVFGALIEDAQVFEAPNLKQAETFGTTLPAPHFLIAKQSIGDFLRAVIDLPVPARENGGGR